MIILATPPSHRLDGLNSQTFGKKKKIIIIIIIIIIIMIIIFKEN